MRMVILSDMHVRFEMLVCLHLLPLATELSLCRDMGSVYPNHQHVPGETVPD